MIKREILGLYLEKELFQYACLRRTLSGWSPKNLGPDLGSSGSIAGPALSSLKEFLKRVSSRKRLHIYLTLPRERFFARDLQLPPMAMEDALVSVQNSLSVYCHLPLDEIYYDIHLCRTSQGNLNALIFYARSKEIDSYLQIFQDAGLRSSLKGLFPVSFGVGAWLKLQRYPMPMGLILSQEGTYELAVYHIKGCLFSATCPSAEGEKGAKALIATARAKFQDLGERIFYLDKGGIPPLPFPSQNRLGKLPQVTENLGIAAAAPSMASQQQISVDGSPTKLRMFPLGSVVIPFILAIILGVFLLTWHTYRDIATHEQKLGSLKTDVEDLNGQIKPLGQKREALKSTEKFLGDIDSFMRKRPRLSSHINEIARLVPEGTWFSYLSYKEGVVSLRGQSQDALKVLDALRSSGMFKQVKLRGSVSKTRTGTERFSLTVGLKDHEKDS